MQSLGFGKWYVAWVGDDSLKQTEIAGTHKNQENEVEDNNWDTSTQLARSTQEQVIDGQ